MRIVLDPGHGGTDRANRGPTGYVEADGVLDIGLRLKKLLIDDGYTVLMTRDKDETVELYQRSEWANQRQGQLFISLHTNAAADSTANGIETFHSYNGEWGSIFREEAKRVAEIIQRRLVQATGFRDRGIKTRLVSNNASAINNMDYYAVIRRSRMPALITEMGFHTNPNEEALLKTAGFRQKLADAIAAGVREAYPLIKSLTPIMGNSVASLQQAKAWLKQRAPEYQQLADIYYSVAPAYGIRADIALCQACKETGYFRYGGLVKSWQNNYAGIGATGEASDGNTPLNGADPSKVRFQQGIHGAIFVNSAVGVEAHIQHLYAYATTNLLPVGKMLYSPRFTLVKRGSAAYVEHLGAADNPEGVGWAYPGNGYGADIINNYLVSLMAAKAEVGSGSINIEAREVKLNIHGRADTIEGFKLEGRNYVPVRFLEAFGYEIAWDEANEIVEIEYRRNTN